MTNPSLFVARSLLTASQLTWLPERTILLAEPNVMGGREAEVELALDAPAFLGGDFSDLYDGLAAWLRSALSVDPDWVFEVTSDDESDPAKLVIAINDPSLLDDNSAAIILAAAQAYLAPIAARRHLWFFTLGPNQRLVPLDNYWKTAGLTVTLPAGLGLVGRSAPWGGEPIPSINDDGFSSIPQPKLMPKASKEFLLEGLKVALATVQRVEDVFLEHGDELQIKVRLRAEDMRNTEAHTLNRIEDIVCEVLKRHATYNGLYTDLVFCHEPRDGSLEEVAEH